MKNILVYSMLTSLILVSIAMTALAKSDFNKMKGKTFKEIDADADGILTKAEFLINAEKRFAEIDQDKNGQITKEESKKNLKKRKEKFKNK